MSISNDIFAIEDIPGKGKGVIARRTISAGELILAESPLFTQPLSRSNASILSALFQVSKAEQREYLSLANAYKGRLLPALGIFQTNVLPCGDNNTQCGDIATTGGLFLVGSRFNSSCQPNVNNYWDEGLQQITFRALTNIASGDELCISYRSLLATRETRRRELKERFGFDCLCVACSLSGDSLEISDGRRTTIARLYDEIPQCSSNPALGLRKVKLALRLLAEEHILEYHADSYYYDGFQFCVAVSDIVNAKAWVRKAFDAYCITKGPDSADAQKMKGYLEDPRTHLGFGSSGKKKLTGPDH